MNLKQCSHNKLYTEPCDDCELIYIDSVLPNFQAIVARMEKQRETIIARQQESPGDEKKPQPN